MINKCVESIKNGDYNNSFSYLYPLTNQQQINRYMEIVRGYQESFGSPDAPLRLFSSPGRAEIGGNHTDHQQGRVLTAAVEMDAAAVAAPTNDGIIRIQSEGYSLVEIDTSDLEKRKAEENTTAAVVRGVTFRIADLGYKIGGFTAYVSSSVPAGSGLSSSASFENLVTTILNSLYNDGKIDPVLTAKIGQYAENVYFGKPSGLLDQAGSAVGGVAYIDFKDKENPIVEPISLNLKDYDFILCVVNTGGDHADLTNDYADIFHENSEVAQFFQKPVLREVEEKDFYTNIPSLRKEFGDRAVLRGMHFFDEDQRVVKQVEALKTGDFEGFKKLVIASGESSFNRLQNSYSPRHLKDQPISLALELSRKLLSDVGGAWRIHGGGFAGTILALVPLSFLDAYKKEMDYVFGEGATQVLAIRPKGSCEITNTDFPLK